MKGLQVTGKNTKIRKGAKKVRRYKNGKKLRKRYEFTKKIRKVTKGLRNRYERRWLRCYLGYEISYERAWLQSYQVTITTFCTTTK